MSDYLENSVINHYLRATAQASPATVYVSLHTASVGDDGTGAEVTGGAYARQAIAFGAPSNGVAANSGVITYPTATAAWGTVTHFGIWDAVSGGNLIYWAPLTASKVIDLGDIAKFNTGDVTITNA